MNRLFWLLVLGGATLTAVAALPFGDKEDVTFPPIFIPGDLNDSLPSLPDFGGDLFGKGDVDYDNLSINKPKGNVSVLAFKDMLMIVILVVLLFWLVRPLRFLRVLVRRPQTRLILTIAAPEMEPLRIPLWKTVGCPRALSLRVGEEVCQTHVPSSFFCMPTLVLPYGWITVINDVSGHSMSVEVVQTLNPWTAFQVHRRVRHLGHVLTFQWEHGGMLYRVVPNALPYNPRDRGSARPPVDSLQSAGPVQWQPSCQSRYGDQGALAMS